MYPHSKSTSEMNKDYTKYKAHQLLNDDYFLESIINLRLFRLLRTINSGNNFRTKTNPLNRRCRLHTLS